jgi:drug/metabolite transporter (DMT)-like permease
VRAEIAQRASEYRGGDGVIDTGGETDRASLGRIYLLLFLTVLMWGGGAVAGKLALRGIPNLAVGLLRFGLAALTLWAVARREFPRWRSLTRSDRWLILGLGAFGGFLNHVLFFAGLSFAPASHAAVIGPTTSPVWTLLLAARFGGERLRAGQVAGSALCMVGVLLVVQPDDLLGEHVGRQLLGDLLLLLSGMVWALYSILSKLAIRRFGPVASLGYGMIVGCGFLVPLVLADRSWMALASASAVAWLALAYLTFATTLLAFFWWNLGIQRVGAGKTAIFSNLVPIFGVLLAWVVLGETLGPIQLGGAALGVAGVWVCQRTPERRDAPDATRDRS